ncbi:protein kinase [Nocardia sp. NPDC023852]|uniref:protein kinase domain-containing protein n=1 Tax=Nocardia sp. NPDC023852 TaxID=3154697 RepID=UPI0033D01E57
MGEMWFGHYRLDRLLGSGGTGEVWLAYDTVANRSVALKVLSAGHAVDPAFRQRFTREARLAAQVRGPHLVPVHSFGELDGRLYIAMGFVEGADVAALLRRDGPMAPAAAVEIVAQTAAALDTVHRAGLVHRDVKPSNLMVTPSGTVYLIDFGTAHRTDQPAITVTGTVVGTLAYMAPERFDGSASARSDQYSLACVLYECLTGQRPFGNGDSVRQLRAHVMDAPPLASEVDPAVPAALDAVIARGMAKDPDQRWSSAGELASAGYAAVTGRDATTVEITPAVVRTRIPPSPRWVPKAARSSRVVARTAVEPRLAVAAITALVAMIAGALWIGRPETADAGPVTPSAPSSEAGHAPRPDLTSQGPAAPPPVPISAPTRVVSAAGQPCDPAVDAQAVAVDGIPLTCVAVAPGSASWTPSLGKPGDEVAAGKADKGGAESGIDEPRKDKPGKDQPGHSNQGNGKPEKPRR